MLTIVNFAAKGRTVHRTSSNQSLKVQPAMIDVDERLKSDKALAKKEGKKLCHALQI